MATEFNKQRPFEGLIHHRLLYPIFEEMGFKVFITPDPSAWAWKMALEDKDKNVFEFNMAHIHNLDLTVTGNHNHSWISDSDGSPERLKQFIDNLAPINFVKGGS